MVVGGVLLVARKKVARREGRGSRGEGGVSVGRGERWRSRYSYKRLRVLYSMCVGVGVWVSHCSRADSWLLHLA